ncbi:MAG: LysR family transcriptional regulator [Proteobacteria bacterium]|nr:LysR family transcriptional regulator [Pseudomonadota bacterium]
MDQLAAMRTFRHIVEARGISAAAQRMDTTHSTVSRQLKQGGFNRSMQHTMPRFGGRSVADEAATPDLLLGGPEGPNVGAVEGRMDDAPDRPPV